MKVTKQRRRGLLRIACLGAAAAGILTAGAVFSMAYWTDETKLGANVSALDIGIEYEAAELALENADQFLPGDRSPLDFKVRNRGAVSVDIKPVIQIHMSKPVKGAAGYRLVSETGEELSSFYDVSYFNGEKEVKTPETKDYDTVTYTAKQFTTLAGSVQNDEVLDRDAASDAVITEKEYQCFLELRGDTGNDFMNTTAEVEVNTHAIQHRNTESVREDTDWMGGTGEENTSGNMETGHTDAGNTDVGNTDASSTDASSTDAESTDAESTDAGNADAGSTDEGSTDTGSTGTASKDVRSIDAGRTDVGSADAGDIDAGNTDIEEEAK